MGHLYHTSYTTASMFHADDMNPPLSSLDAAIAQIKGNMLIDAGTIGWDVSTGALSWSEPMQLICIDPDSGKIALNQIASGSLTIPAGNIAYADLSTVNGATISATFSTISTASTAINPRNRIIFGAVSTALKFFPKALSVPLDTILNANSTLINQHNIDSTAAHISTATPGNIFIADADGLPVGSSRSLDQYAGARESSIACAATFTIDFSTAETRFVSLTTNASAIIMGGVNGHTYRLRVQQDATGNWTLALGATANTIKWAGGAAPTVTTAATVSDIITLTRSNGTWFGSYNQAYA